MIAVGKILQFGKVAEKILLLEMGVLGLDLDGVVRRIFGSEFAECHRCKGRGVVTKE